MLEVKQTISEMKNSFDGLINRLHKAEERIKTFEDRFIEIIQNKTQKKEVKRAKESIQQLWDIK